jgi:hypothetical protein
MAMEATCELHALRALPLSRHAGHFNFILNLSEKTEKFFVLKGYRVAVDPCFNRALILSRARCSVPLRIQLEIARRLPSKRNPASECNKQVNFCNTIIQLGFGSHTAKSRCTGISIWQPKAGSETAGGGQRRIEMLSGG